MSEAFQETKPEQAPLRDSVESALRSVIDPELGINIVDLGLVYDITVHDGEAAHILMTMTTPRCPMHETIASDVQRAPESLPRVRSAKVQVTYAPPWTPQLLSPRARILLGR